MHLYVNNMGATFSELDTHVIFLVSSELILIESIGFLISTHFDTHLSSYLLFIR